MQSGRLAPVGGKPPLTCFHISPCGLISSAYITRTGLGATHVNGAPTRSAGAVDSGRLSLRMLACQPRNVIRSQAGSPAGPRSPASYLSHTRFRRGTQATELLSSRSRTDAWSSQSFAGTRPPEGRNRAGTRSELVLVTSNGLALTSGACHCWVDGADSSSHI